MYIAVSCYEPPTLQNASITFHNTSFVGDVAVYECDHEYAIRGNKENTTISCTSFGTWSTFLDNCEGGYTTLYMLELLPVLRDVLPVSEGDAEKLLEINKNKYCFHELYL